MIGRCLAGIALLITQVIEFSRVVAQALLPVQDCPASYQPADRQACTAHSQEWLCYGQTNPPIAARERATWYDAKSLGAAQ